MVFGNWYKPSHRMEAVAKGQSPHAITEISNVQLGRIPIVEAHAWVSWTFCVRGGVAYTRLRS